MELDVERAVVLARLARAVALEQRSDSLPTRLCRACVSLLDADGGAITLAYTSPQRLTVCATTEGAARLEDLQDILGEGPGPDAFSSGRMVSARMTSGALSVWPVFAKAALEAVGPAAVYAFPMAPGAQVIGVLTV